MKIRSPRTAHSIGIYDYVSPRLDQIRQTLEKEMGWDNPTDKPEHMDCLLHELPFYIYTLKFPELTPSTFYHSGLIRLGLMTREEAMDSERERLDNPQVPAVLDSFLAEIGVSRDEFHASVRDWRATDRFRGKKRRAMMSVYRKLGGI